MSRLLLLGPCPLPAEDRAPVAPGARRLALFLEAARDRGHDVRLMALRREDDYRHAVPPVVRHRLTDGFDYEALRKDFFLDERLLVSRHDDWRPNAVIGAGCLEAAVMAPLAAVVAAVPAWIDLPSSVLQELADAPAFVPRLPDALARADRVSAADRGTEDVALGMLGFVGRLNRRTAVAPLNVTLRADARETAESPDPLEEWLAEPAFAADREGGTADAENALLGLFSGG